MSKDILMCKTKSVYLTKTKPVYLIKTNEENGKIERFISLLREHTIPIRFGATEDQIFKWKIQKMSFLEKLKLIWKWRK